ncbi:MAG TPA: type I phosphomannose isomerase catalytic subunit [Opitutales bacterium]|nr:type I phosphomannose isomerase catalytic subunit [Opitutales bacterium]
MAPQLLRFAPIYQERVWGGRALEASLRRALPAAGPIGESWEIVDRPEAQSLVTGGPWHGRTLHELVERETAALLGPRAKATVPFPILVKWLDARERLSLQVHPPAALAKKLRGEPKTENWYVAEAAPGAALIAGLQPGVTREKFEAALCAQTLEPLVHRFPVQRGDSLFVPSGRLHAIDAGLLILEIQQNSDTTYRVYDWGRVGLDGKPRQLHVAESLQCIDFSDVAPAAIPASAAEEILADCPYFRIRRVPLAAGAELKFAANDQPRIISVAEGRLVTDDPAHAQLERGANVLIPYAGSAELLATTPSILLVTENFC